MARQKHTGAEVAALLELDSSSVGANSIFESSATFARSGARSWRAHKPATALGEAAFGSYVLAAAANYWVSGVIRVDSTNWADGVSREVMQLGAGAGEFVVVDAQRNGSDLQLQVGVRNGIGELFGNPITIANGIDSWVPFVLAGDFNAGADNASVWAIVDDSSGTILQSLVSNDRISANFDSLDFGLTESSVDAARVYFDDLVVDNSDAGIGSFPLAPWNRHLIYIEPSADNGAQGWATVGAGADHAARVSDGDDTTGNQATGNGALNDLYDCSNSTASGGIANTITGASFPAASFYSRDQLPVASVVQGVYTFRLTAAAANFDTNFTVPLAGVTLRTIIRNTDPGGGAWSQADIDGTQFAPRYAAGQGATAGARVNEMWGYFEASLGSNLSDPFTFVETAQEIKAKVNLSDPFSIVETASIKAKVDLSDPLSFVDVEAIKAKIDQSDPASIVEIQDIEGRVDLSDSLTTSETQGIKAKVNLTDPMSFTDEEKIKAKIALDDPLTIVETVEIQEFGKVSIIAIYDDL
jgi:hypothetical protein